MQTFCDSTLIFPANICFKIFQFNASLAYVDESESLPEAIIGGKEH